MHRYNAAAVDKEIAKDRRIKGREARMIRALLRGRQATDEYPATSAAKGLDL